MSPSRPGATHALIRGPTSIAELMTFGGASVEVLGTPGTYDTLVQATTLDLSANTVFVARHVTVGWVLDRATRGYVGVNGPGAVARFEHACYHDLTTVSHRTATIIFRDSSPAMFADGSHAAIHSIGRPVAFQAADESRRLR